MLLLHGFPTSSHMFRNLIPLLAGDCHVIAPDLPGYGLSDAPDHSEFEYTFDHLAEIIGDLVEQMGLKKFTLYIFDYGAPVVLRVALRFPDRISALISQNGNAYVEGFSKEWEPWQRYWREPTPENREACRDALSPQVIRDIQYCHGANPELVSPDGYMLDIAYMARPGADEAQLDLILDYRSNVALYPKFQEFFRNFQPPTLAVWGKNDPFFLPPGAEAYRRDNPKAQGGLPRHGPLRPGNSCGRDRPGDRHVFEDESLTGNQKPKGARLCRTKFTTRKSRQNFSSLFGTATGICSRRS